MKKHLTFRALAATAFACLLVLVIGACSSSAPEKYVVYETKPTFTDVGDTMHYYQVVFYRESGKKDDIEIIKHKNDILTGMADEIHLSKDTYSEDEANELADSVYEDIDSISCGTKSVTDEGDYWCILYKFTGLDKKENVKQLVDAEILTSSDGSDEDADYISAGAVMQSIALSLGTTELTEEEVAGLDLHFGK